MRKIWWTDFAAREFENLDPEKTIAILPIAAVEQHGPHLPVGTDTIINTSMNSIFACCRFRPLASPTNTSGPKAR